MEKLNYYVKWRLRDSIEFPIISLALRVDQGEGGRIEKGRIVFSGVGSGPVEASEGEKMLSGATLDDGVIEEVSKRAVKEISPMRTAIYSPAYKRKMVQILVKQALEQMKHVP